MSRFSTLIPTLVTIISLTLIIATETKIKNDVKVAFETISTNNGDLMGTSEQDIDGNRYYSFLRIPYAKPPIGDLRFEDPKPADNWEGVREAVVDLPECAQVGLGNVITGVEDCLYLNVFTPELPSKDAELKPVMVFIHGGGLQDGFGGKKLYSPDFLMTEGVVLVSINYRLGIFGFFSLKNGTTFTSGNAGLKDQTMALEWVRDNIQAFGGSPIDVTIFGESAGGTSVHLHVLSEKSKGLFNRAIMQSGTVIKGLGNGDNADALAKVLGINTDDNQQMLQKLRALSSEEILKAQIQSTSSAYAIIESNHTDAFISSTPYDIVTSGSYNHVTLMIGYNDAEGIARDQLNRALYNESRLVTDFTTLIPSEFNIDRHSAEAEALAVEIKRLYYGDAEPSFANMVPYIQIYTDISFAYPSNRAVKLHSKTSKAPVYFYRFSADTELNVYKGRDDISKAYKGASHCDELGYLFMTDLTEPFDKNTVQYVLMKRMVKLWTSFAKYGKPSAGEDFDWLEVTPHVLNYLDFSNSGMDMKTDPDKARMDFWSEKYKIYVDSLAVCLRSSPILVLLYILFTQIY